MKIVLKQKVAYVCSDCGADSKKWSGQCGACGAWNTLSEIVVSDKPVKNARQTGYAAATDAVVRLLKEVPTENLTRSTTNISELDRVLGGGLVAGSVVLLGGDPGIGKSTLLLQTVAKLSQTQQVLYVTGEESLAQVSLRAERLGVSAHEVKMLAETHIERILQLAIQNRPDVLVIDSIQTMFTELLQAAPGSVSQVRESAAQLVRFAKQTNTALFVIGHVTKEGALAGPRVLEHMVDTVLYFEGRTDSRYRVIRAVKNRFGAVNELGVFAMTDKGLKEVANPSAIFLTGKLTTATT